jgi:hypothetical protein
MKGYLTVLLAISMVFFSGCTSPLGGGGSGDGLYSSGQGLVIREIRPDYNYVMSGDSVTIKARLQNMGDRNIWYVKAEPFLLPWPGFDVIRDDCPPMTRPNPQTGTLGGVCDFTWTVIAPRVSKQETFPLGVRFYYDYATQTSAKVFAVSEAKYLGLMERGENPPMARTIENSNSPINVQVYIDNVIIIPQSGEREVPVTLQFTNTISDGYPVPATPGPDLFNPRKFQLTSVKVDTEYTGGMTLVNKQGDCNSGPITMRGGKSGDCIIWLRVSPQGQMDEIVADIKITTEYTYAIEGRSQITVNPPLIDRN